MRLLRQLVQRHHEHLPLQQPLTSPKKSAVNHSDRAVAPARTAPARDQSAPPATGLTTGQALDEIARLANGLCDHLTDDQWRTADQIRYLAETARTSTGAS